MTQREVCERILAGSCNGVDCLNHQCPASSRYDLDKWACDTAGNGRTTPLAKRRARAWLEAHPEVPDA